ncbi:UDP-N-acetylmuramate--L-alanine ligase [Demetria terragena]|uniref:UDP-N-acetylmuramate--L-alanine ligase n=1 Tax=Demetria terragena TaxID=63959 RepID=UPI00035CFC90|nr:UDP-N-acetylmuramate--L-alanine ligase [Demetria terragena]
MAADGTNDRFDFAARLPQVGAITAVHLLAIGGSGMSGVARLFLARGLTVSGTDGQDVAVLATLRGAGATINVGFSADHVAELPDDALVIVSSAIAEDNPELREIRRRGLTVLHRSQGLAMLMADRSGLAVAGANGKTTTSAMATVALRGCGADPSYAIGADIAGLGANAMPGNGSVFVVEADESDGSFVVYRPDVAIVTNVRDDHLDFYGTSERLHGAYAQFAETISTDGLLVACADDAGSRDLATRHHAGGGRVITYGREPSDVRIVQERSDGFRQDATLHLDGIDLDLTLNVPGAHNVLNAAGVVAALTRGLGLDAKQVAASLADFRGTSRRFEPRGEAAGIRVVDDYAHNPGKLEAVVRTGLALRDQGRLIVVFQPHLYSRTQHAADGLAAALCLADHAVVLDIYGAREQPVPGVTGRLVSDQVPGATFAADHQDALDAVTEIARSGDLVLTVGAGDVTALGPRILDQLERRVADLS